ncbi:hypothetical protein ASZ90_016133 [hydrocarbon metagenome]|uniref:Uncharacterized protein n=1 Tax=hydrocarbon metagenome TaxID=938273 RepID=A0A0W8F026_9ZZZZ
MTPPWGTLDQPKASILNSGSRSPQGEMGFPAGPQGAVHGPPSLHPQIKYRF